jgi:hypothetical protein
MLMRICKLWKTSYWRLVPRLAMRLADTTHMKIITVMNRPLVLKLKHA